MGAHRSSRSQTLRGRPCLSRVRASLLPFSHTHLQADGGTLRRHVAQSFFSLKDVEGLDVVAQAEAGRWMSVSSRPARLCGDTLSVLSLCQGCLPSDPPLRPVTNPALLLLTRPLTRGLPVAHKRGACYVLPCQITAVVSASHTDAFEPGPPRRWHGVCDERPCSCHLTPCLLVCFLSSSASSVTGGEELSDPFLPAL